MKRLRIGSAAIGAGLLLLATAGSALASDRASFGPQTWSNGATSGRYRSHAGTHLISAYGCSGSHSVELRIDKVNATDISAGTKTVSCTSVGTNYSSSIDSYTTQYRGHFMQNRSAAWYGQLSDLHP